MHHTEICLIMDVIDEYFLLTQFEPKYHLKKVIDKDGKRRVITLCTSLMNGYLEVIIDGRDKDSWAMKFYYYETSNDEKPSHIVQFPDNTWGESVIRDGFKEVLIIEKAKLYDQPSRTEPARRE